MRVYLARRIGTGGPIEQPLPESEWYWLDGPDYDPANPDPPFEGAELISTYIVDDSYRPDVDPTEIVGESRSTEVVDGGRPDRPAKYVSFTPDAFYIMVDQGPPINASNPAPTGTVALARDPLDRTQMNDRTPNNARNAIEDFLGLDRRFLRNQAGENWRRRRVIRWLTGERDWRQTIGVDELKNTDPDEGPE